MSIDINELRDMLGNLCVQTLQQSARAQNAETLLLEKTKELDELKTTLGTPSTPVDLDSLDLAVDPGEIQEKLKQLRRGPSIPAMPKAVPPSEHAG